MGDKVDTDTDRGDFSEKELELRIFDEEYDEEYDDDNDDEICVCCCCCCCVYDLGVMYGEPGKETDSKSIEFETGISSTPYCVSAGDIDRKSVV